GAAPPLPPPPPGARHVGYRGFFPKTPHGLLHWGGANRDCGVAAQREGSNQDEATTLVSMDPRDCRNRDTRHVDWSRRLHQWIIAPEHAHHRDDHHKCPVVPPEEPATVARQRRGTGALAGLHPGQRHGRLATRLNDRSRHGHSTQFVTIAQQSSLVDVSPELVGKRMLKISSLAQSMQGGCLAKSSSRVLVERWSNVSFW